MLLSPYRIRRAQETDVPLLPPLEREAVGLFQGMREELGLGPVVQVTSTHTLRAAAKEGRLWVAVAGDDRPVGFALIFEIDNNIHMHQLNVLPAHGRRGLGTALANEVCAWARASGYPAVTLSTFRDIPWNAPLWARCGFEVVPSEGLSPGLVQVVEAERARGMRMELRVIMRREL